MSDPLKQFEIETLYEFPEICGLKIALTNASLFMILATILPMIFLYCCTVGDPLRPGRMQIIGEMLFGFLNDMVINSIGKAGLVFLPMIFLLFTFIASCNLFGLVPHAFTVTSSFAVTIALAVMVFFTVTITGFVKHGLSFFKIFLPSGTPWWLAPLLFSIEFFTYLMRPFILALRLSGNMIVGHIAIKVIAGIIASLPLLAVLVFIPIVSALTALELLVAFLQAYIFTALTCVYLNDAVNMH